MRRPGISLRRDRDRDESSFDNLFAIFPGAKGATSGKQKDGNTIASSRSRFTARCFWRIVTRRLMVDYDGGSMDGLSEVDVSRKSCRLGLRQCRSSENPTLPHDGQAVRTRREHVPDLGSATLVAPRPDPRRLRLDASCSAVDFPTHAPWGGDAQKGTTTPVSMRMETRQEGACAVLYITRLRATRPKR